MAQALPFMVISALLAGCSISFAADPHLLLGIQNAISSGDLNAASQELQGALSKDPDDPGLLNLRGVVHARRNEIDAARGDFLAAVQRSPSLTPAWQNLARACQMEAVRNPDMIRCATDAWRHVTHFLPQNGEAHLALADIYLQQGRALDCMRELGAVRDSESRSTPALTIRCLDLCVLNRLQEAKSVAATLVRQSDFSEGTLDSMHGTLDSKNCAPVLVVLARPLAARQTASIKLLKRLAIAYENAGQLNDARATLERVAVQDSGNPAHLLELARLAQITKDYQGALGYLAHARDLAPNDARIHFLFGLTAAQMELPVEARKSLERALALEPENPDYNYAMGTVILQTRKPGDSIPYFRKAVAGKPADPRYAFALGIAYFASGDYDSAKKEIQPLGTDAKLGPGVEYFLGRIARINGQNDSALKHLRRSTQLLPSFAEPHVELARVLIEQDKLAEAGAELSQALKLNPNSFQANAQLLIIYKRTRDPRQEEQAARLKKLDEERSRRAELMLRTVELRP